MARMNEQVILVAEEIARRNFTIGDNYYLDSYTANTKQVKLVFSNENLIKVTVQLPYYLVEATVEERGFQD